MLEPDHSEVESLLEEKPDELLENVDYTSAPHGSIKSEPVTNSSGGRKRKKTKTSIIDRMAMQLPDGSLQHGKSSLKLNSYFLVYKP